MFWRGYMGVLLWGALALLAVGCGDGGGEGDGATAAKIKSFSVSADSIVAGESVVLSWETERATSLTLSREGVAIDLGDAEVRAGSVEVQPTRSSDYRLSAYGNDGKAVSRIVSVEVLPMGPPTIADFSASAETVARHEPFTLSWETAGATSIRIVAGGRDIALGESASPAAGEVEVTLTTSTTFTLIAEGPGGERREDARVTVAPIPTVELHAAVDVVDAGTTTSLSWTFGQATEIVIREEGGDVLTTSTEPQGSLDVQIDRTAVFVAEVTGPGGKATATAKVESRPVIVSFVAQAQGAARPGDLAHLTWETLGAEELVVSNAGGFRQIIAAHDREQGSLSAPVAAGGGFILEASSGSRTVQASAIVETTELPLVRSFKAGQLVTAGSGQVGESTVEWLIDGASTIRLEVEPGGLVDLTNKSPRADSVNVLFSDCGTLTLTASNAAGQVQVQIASPVDPVPTFPRFAATPSRAGAGEAVELYWETANAQTIVLERDGADQEIDPSLVTGGTTTGPLATDATFRLRAQNSLGFEAVSDDLVVQVGAPNILSLGTDDERLRVPVGTTVNLVWENDGGTSLELRDQSTGQVVCQTSDTLQIKSGGCSVTMPLEQETKTFVMEVANASGTDTQTLDVQAVTGAIIEEFYTDLDEITEGDTLFFYWVTTPDVEGNIPSLTLHDNHGNSYPLDDIVGEEALEGSAWFPISMWSEYADPIPADYGYTFTLTATADNPPAFTLSHDVTVHAIPVVDDMAANPAFAETEGEQVDFSWATTHGASLELFLLDRDGEIASGAVYATDAKAEVDAGSASLTPQIATPDVRVRVRNPVGYVTEADFRIGVDPATVVSFTANGVEAPGTVDILDGETLALEWETARSDEVLLREGYVDISSHPNAVELDLSSTTSATGYAVIDFPEGFSFPYDGEAFTSLRAVNGGFLTFGLSGTLSSGNQELPYTGGTASYRQVHLAPFWDAVRPQGTNGGLWALFEEGDRDRLIVQWKNYEFTSSTYNPADLNFQVALYEDGTFEFRYGAMDGSHANARAASASVGTTNPENTGGVGIVYNDEQVNGFEGRVYRFGAYDQLLEAASTPIPAPFDGSMVFKPSDSKTYTLSAWNGHSDHDAELTVNVHGPAALSVWTEPEFPLPGDSVELFWSGENLGELTIEDESGATILTASPSELVGGSMPLGVLAQGSYSFTFQGVGQIARDTISEIMEVLVYDPFSLDAFDASAERIKLGESVDLSWATTNATSATIEDLNTGAVQTIDVADLDQGSMPWSPTASTTYRLSVESHGRYVTEEVTVEVRTVRIDDFSASATTIPGGSDLTLSWDTTADGTVSFEPMLGLVEVAPAFEDISNLGQNPIYGPNSTSGVSRLYFPQGFTFPFYGEEKDFVQVSVEGYISFDADATSTSANQSLPNTGTSYQRVHMPIFWDDLNTRTGRIDAVHLPNPDRYIIQWTNVERHQPTTGGYDLNFQIVLFPDGSFEYRYGTMAPPTTPATSTTHCNPFDCIEETNGSSATIGFQKPGGTEGFLLHYGTVSTDLPFIGGLANRTFRAEPTNATGLGSRTFRPSRSGSYTLCIEDEDWRECEELYVNVVEPGDILITELMVSPVDGVNGQWFEIRNISQGEIDLEGMVINVGGQSHTIQSGGPLIVPRNGHAVLARSNNPSVDPDYVYGTGLEMSSAGGSVSIEWDGILLGETTWDATWAFGTGVSLELRSDKTRPGIVTRDDAADYCDATATYDGGTNMGTPGSLSGCSAHGYVFDPFSDKAFIDIREIGTRSGHLNADTASSYLTNGMGFSMPFFTGVVDELWMNSNGLMGFGNSNSTSTASNRELGTGTLANTGIVAGFWDDLTVADDLSSWVGFHLLTIDGQQVRIVQYDGSKIYNQTGAITFQVQLWEGGDIVIAFREIDDTGSPNRYKGSSATIGIEAPGGTAFIQYLFNETHLRPHQSLYFKRL